MKHFVFYCSPNGSTRRVAEVIARRLSEHGESVEMFDLGKKEVRRDAVYQLALSPKCLWVGSPVYVSHAVPPVERFLSELEQEKGCYAVPFVTWGGVTSGVALSEMASLLAGKGHTLLGGAKVMAVHSFLWKSSNPLGSGRPDAEDEALVRSLADAVCGKLALSEISGLPPDAFDYQSEAFKEEARLKSVAAVKKIYPELVCDAQKCTQCGECAEHCPAGAIALSPYPVFADDCFLCWNCVRACPEGAIPFDLPGAEDRLRAMAEAIGEGASTRIFV